MPKLEYPAFFDGGLKGVRCTEDIEHREAFLFVPFKMMITVKGIHENEVLKPIIEKHRECFREDEYKIYHWENLTLTLGLLYQIALGKKSYWYPYLREIQIPITISSFWNSLDIQMAQDKNLAFLMESRKVSLE